MIDVLFIMSILNEYCAYILENGSKPKQKISQKKKENKNWKNENRW